MADEKWNRLYFPEWVAKEGLDLIRDKVDDVFTVPLKYWPRTEGYAVHIQLAGTGDLNAAYVCEIPAGKQLTPQRHLYEELTYVLSGQGSTTVWYEGQRKTSFEWAAGSLFAIPLNAWHQHFNGSGATPARYVSMTTAPIVMNLIRNEDFVFNNDAVFADRYDSAENYFSGQVDIQRNPAGGKARRLAVSNFFADINGIADEHLNTDVRGPGTRSISFMLAQGVLGSHILELPGGTFSNLHRHGPGAHVLWLKGEGYTLMWGDGGPKVKSDWRRGSIVVPPDWWWHQHCVVSQEPAQHLALRLGSARFDISRQNEGVMQSTREGGNMMENADFPPEIMSELRDIFEEECAKRGTISQKQALAY